MARRKRLEPYEWEEQVALMDKCELNSGEYPELGLLFHIPNGAGKLPKWLGARLKKMGLKEGMHDCLLPVSRGGYHGMFIEMKSATGKPTDRQIWWAQQLYNQGYLCVLCYSAELAWDCLMRYLKGGYVRQA